MNWVVNIYICCFTLSIQLSEQNKIESVRVITWTTNPPYYLETSFREDEHHTGIIMTLLKTSKNICLQKNEFIKIVHDKVNVIKTHEELVELILQNDTERMLRNLNVTRDEKQLIVIGASSFSHLDEVNKNFSIKTLVNSERAAVIVHSNDNLLLVKFFSAVSQCFVVIYFAAIVAIIVSTAVWLLEHQINENIPKTFSKGLWTCFWFCFVTMTTVGYGDIVVKHFVTKTIIIIWMVFGLMMTSMITATVLEELQQTVDTKGHHVSVLSKSAETELVTQQLHAKPIELETYEEVLNAVKERKVKAALIDANVAAVLFNQKHSDELIVERILTVLMPINIFILSKNCSTNALVNAEQRKSIEAKYIPPLTTKLYHIRAFTKIFEKTESGEILYTTIVAGFLVLIAILTECIKFIKTKLNGRRVESKNCKSVDLENRRLKLIADLKKLINDLESREIQKLELSNMVCS